MHVIKMATTASTSIAPVTDRLSACSCKILLLLLQSRLVAPDFPCPDLARVVIAAQLKRNQSRVVVKFDLIEPFRMLLQRSLARCAQWFQN